MMTSRAIALCRYGFIYSRCFVGVTCMVTCMATSSGACITKAVPAGAEFDPADESVDVGSGGETSLGSTGTTTIPVESGTGGTGGTTGTGDVGESTVAGTSGEDDAGTDDGAEEDQDPKFDLSPIPDTDGQPNPDCDIDFLFVIDNSGSMANEQRNVANSVPGFINTITTEILNLNSYHIGVITTDENPLNGIGTSCAQMGGLTIQTVDRKGTLRDCGPYNSGANYIDASDNVSQAFECAANVGISGSVNETPFDAIAAALGPELKNQGGCNEGFLRPNAVLVVVLITDEEDDYDSTNPELTGSFGAPQDWYQNLLAVKDSRPEYLVMLSLIGTEPPNSCSMLLPPGQGGLLTSEGAEVSPRIREFTELFGDRGVVGDVCASNYDPFFDSAVSVLKSACANIPEG